MSNFKLNWCFHCLLWNMYSLRFVTNINANIQFENVLENQFDFEARVLSSYGSVRSKNNSLKRNIFAIDYFDQDWNRPFKMNSRLCTFVFAQMNEKQSDDKTRFSDTLTQDDIVRNQYSFLPYPAVSKRELEAEWQYYRNKQNTTPYNIIFAFTLESLNHYLYKGQNTFRWVSGTVLVKSVQNSCYVEHYMMSYHLYNHSTFLFEVKDFVLWFLVVEPTVESRILENN